MVVLKGYRWGGYMKVSLYDQLSNLLSQIYPESFEEHHRTLRSISSMLAQKTYAKIKNQLDPVQGLPDAIQVWFPIWYPKTRLGIQFTDTRTIGIYIQQSLEPNGDFNSQIRFAEFKIPPALTMTALTLGWGGFLIYSLEKARSDGRQAILQELEKTNKLLQEQGGSCLTETCEE